MGVEQKLVASLKPNVSFGGHESRWNPYSTGILQGQKRHRVRYWPLVKAELSITVIQRRWTLLNFVFLSLSYFHG